YDLVPALEQLLPDDLRALLGDSDPLPPGSTVLGDPAAIALRDAAVEPGVVFDVRNGPVVLESGAEVRAGARLEGPLWVGANAHVLGGPVRASAIGPRTNARGELSSCVDATRPPKYMPPFAWGGAGGARMSRDGFLKIAGRVLPRRDVVVDDATRAVLERIYDWATR